MLARGAAIGEQSLHQVAGDVVQREAYRHLARVNEQDLISMAQRDFGLHYAPS